MQQVYGGRTFHLIDVAFEQKLLDDRVAFEAEFRKSSGTIIPELESPTPPKLKHDSSTNNLIRRCRKMKGAS
jgi:hypothetical protein